jgi:hypothetical protein
MELVDVSFKLPKEGHDIGAALAVILKTAISSGKDGFQAAPDLLAVATAALMSLPAALDGVANLPAEAKGKPGSFSVAIVAPALVELDSLVAPAAPVV